MPQINITFIDPHGKQQKCHLPDDKPIERMFIKLSEALKLSGSIADFTFQSNRQTLDVHKSFRELEVGDGATVQILRAPSTSDPRLDAKNELGVSARPDYYVAQANSRWPALIVFLIDASGSMESRFGTETRIKVVEAAFRKMIKVMIRRSMRGTIVSSRYRVALFTYSNTIIDVYRGIKTIEEVANTGYPDLHPSNETNTQGAFAAVRDLLKIEIPRMQAGIPGGKDSTFPAPLVCHLTDGFYTQKYGDPEPIVSEIKQLSVPDGHVLVENIFIPEEPGDFPLGPDGWSGFTPKIRFPKNFYADKLLSMSSIVPDSYRAEMMKAEYRLDPGTVMFYPGTSPELVQLAFQMSISTPQGDK